VDELASEVASASRQQTQGITQINTAVGQMDKVTQSNAASAEESAAAAEELNSQAIEMKHAVGELSRLVGGKVSAPKASPMPARSAAQFRSVSSAPAKPVASKPLNGNGHHPVAGTPSASGRRKEFPLEGDFKDF
jgi:hypothetical protein